MKWKLLNRGFIWIYLSFSSSISYYFITWFIANFLLNNVNPLLSLLSPNDKFCYALPKFPLSTTFLSLYKLIPKRILFLLKIEPSECNSDRRENIFDSLAKFNFILGDSTLGSNLDLLYTSIFNVLVLGLFTIYLLTSSYLYWYWLP